MDPIFSEFNLPVITLVNLDKLQITGIDYHRNGSLAPLLQSIRCPSLSTVSLRGEYEGVIDVMEHLGRISNPSNLELRYHGRKRRDLVAPISFQLPSVTHLLVEAYQHAMGISEPEVGRIVNAAIRIANNAIVLRVILCLRPSWTEGEKVMECVRHDGSSEEECNSISRQDAILELVGTALTEIDIKVLAPTVLFFVRPCTVARISSQVLTKLACRPYELLPILSQHPLPVLNTIHLHAPESLDHERYALEELSHFDRDITRWIIKHLEGHVPLRVHTFGLSWFPNWRSFLPMLYCMSKSLTDGQDLTIKLPAYPHPVIQRALILALEGADDGSNSIPSVPLDAIVSSGVKG